MYAFP